MQLFVNPQLIVELTYWCIIYRMLKNVDFYIAFNWNVSYIEKSYPFL